MQPKQVTQLSKETLKHPQHIPVALMCNKILEGQPLTLDNKKMMMIFEFITEKSMTKSAMCRALKIPIGTFWGWMGHNEEFSKFVVAAEKIRDEKICDASEQVIVNAITKLKSVEESKWVLKSLRAAKYGDTKRDWQRPPVQVNFTMPQNSSAQQVVISTEKE